MRWFVLLALVILVVLLLLQESESWGSRRRSGGSSARRRSSSARRRSYSSRRRSFATRRRSYSARRRSYSARRRSYSARRRSFSTRRRSYATRRRSSFTRRRSSFTRRRTSITRRRSYPGRRRHFPGRRRHFPRRRRYFPGRRRYFPGRRRYFPGRRRYFPGRRRYFPGRRRYFPGRRRYFPGRRRYLPRRRKNSKDFKVRKGQLTFNVEGNNNPKSKHFSRKPHVPGKWSGVTIGRGYDLGQRKPAEIARDLKKIGVDQKTIDKFKKASNLKGQKAREFLKKNNLQDFTITPKQQKKLFERTYPRYVASAKRVVEKYSNNGVKFNSLSPVAKDIATDIVYRGDYEMNKKKPAKMKRTQRIQKVLESKSLQQLKDLMSDKKFWKEAGVDDNRFDERKKAVEAACKADPNCK